MEDIREMQSEKDSTVVAKRLKMTATKLQYVAGIQKAGYAAWCLKTGKDYVIPEVNFNKFWDAQKQALITHKPRKAATVKPQASRKRARESDGCSSNKKPRTGQTFTLMPGPVYQTVLPGCSRMYQPAQQVPNLAAFGLQYQLEIRPIE